MRTITFAALAFLIALAPTVQAQRRAQSYPLRSSTPLDRDDINRMLETAERSRETWILDPTETAHAIVRHLGYTHEPGNRVSVTRTNVPRGAPRTSTVVVTIDGLQDDSVASMRYGFTFARSVSGRAWRVTWASVSHRCWSGRGVSTAFIAENCI